jgi:LDH2 family malate/lactate/ureidoglycolate dehydrogenase
MILPADAAGFHMQIAINDARRLIEDAMVALKHSGDEAALIADHLIDCELRGVSFGGLPRALSIVERVRGRPDRRKPIEIARETAVSALVQGHDQVGYLVAHRATTIAIAKAKQNGIGVAGANDTWYTGMFSYYLEMAAREDLVSMAIGNAYPRVAPHGSTEGRFGTNPIAFGFPSLGDPVIWDIGTSAVMAGEVALALRTGAPLPEGVAYDEKGNPTRDAAAAGRGAYAVWGGAKGSGLAMCVQMLGMMCNTLPFPPLLAGCGFFVLCMSPSMFMDLATFKGNVSEYAAAVRTAKPINPAKPVRMPFDRSAETRRKVLARGTIEVAEETYRKLEAVGKRVAPSRAVR